MGTHARRPPASIGRPSLSSSWGSQPLALRVLRAFLGVTFAYAGVQKLLDPNFLHAGTSDYIGSQLQAFANGSPIGWFLRILAHVPVLTGIGIALTEIAIGLATLLGVARYAAAIGGFAVSAALFLSATWHVHPYFLGSDSAYAVAWLAYLAGMWELDRRRAVRPSGPPAARTVSDPGRRQLLRGAAVAGATVLLAGAARALVGRPTSAAEGFTDPVRPQRTKGGGHGSSGPRTTGGGQGSGPPTTGPGPSTPAPPEGPTPHPNQPPPVAGRTITTLDSVPVGGAVPFTGPGGEPCALVRLGQHKVAAYSRICTHAGCEVGWDSTNRLLVCPCHGAEFDPAQGAAPVAGPAPTPLSPVRVVVDRSRGTVVLPK